MSNISNGLVSKIQATLTAFKHHPCGKAECIVDHGEMHQIMLSARTVIRDIWKFIGKAKNSNEAFKLHGKQNSSYILDHPLFWF